MSAPPPVPPQRTAKENVRVVCRFRPVNGREASLPETPDEEYSLLIDEKQHIVGLRHAIGPNKRGMALGQRKEESHNFVFDKVFGPDTSQSIIFQEVAKDAVHWISEGYNSTIFAYGQTGTGKTFTMFGPEAGDPKLRGIIPRSVEQLFHEIAENPDVAEVNVKCSFLEIYKENIRDLLMPSDEYKRLEQEFGYVPGLKIRQSLERGVYVQGLIEHYVYSPKDVLNLIKEGELYRTTAQTTMNDVSSRSHSVLSITVTQTLKDGTIKQGKLNLVDLAGSENVNKSQAEGKTLSEAQKINKSLSALGNVIYALTERNREHVPYRDSKLTYLLQDSLGGNTKTVLLVTASPHESAMSETLSTLKFAKRAKEIKNIPRVNKQESVSQLKAVVAYLEEQLNDSEQRNKELQVILEALGVERDEAGQYKVPKDLQASQLDNKAANQAKAREIRLLRRLDRYEKRIEKLEKTRKKEQAYYAQLKDLFSKQRDLAQSLSAKLRKRDETILFLTNEIDEYAQFQAQLEEAAEKNPQLLASLMKTRVGSIRGPKPEAGSLTSAAAGLRVNTAASIANYEFESPPDSPTESERSSSMGSLLSGKQHGASSKEIRLGFKPSPSVENVLKGVEYKSGSATSLSSPLNSVAEKPSSPQEEAARRQAAQQAAAMKAAVRILEAGGIFVKYPYGGFMAKKSTKQIFYDTKSGQLFYWDVDKKIKTTSKYLSVADITDLYMGKQTPAFEKAIAKAARDDCCFSVKDASRTLDLEAETPELRDAWVCALHYVATKRNAKLTLHGDLPAGKRNPLNAAMENAASDANDEENEEQSGEITTSAGKLAPVVRVESGDNGSDDSPSHSGALVPRRAGDRLPSFNYSGPRPVQVTDPTREEILREMASADRDSKEALRKTYALKADPMAPTMTPEEKAATDIQRVFRGAQVRRSLSESGQLPGDSAGADADDTAAGAKSKKRSNGDSKHNDSDGLSESESDNPNDDFDDAAAGHQEPVAKVKLENIRVKALYDFNAKSDLQLSFKKGDILTVLTKKKQGWWDARLGSKIGSIPYNYVQEIPDS